MWDFTSFNPRRNFYCFLIFIQKKILVCSLFLIFFKYNKFQVDLKFQYYAKQAFAPA